MDGTESDLKKVVELSRKYSGVVVLDEAHSVGLYAENGRGFCLRIIRVYLIMSFWLAL